MKGRVYLDSSAYLAMLLGEEAGAEIERRVESAEVLSSVLLVLEAIRTLVRLSREGRMSEAFYDEAMGRLRQDLEGMRLRNLTLDLCQGLSFPAITLPKSSDLAHLRTAVSYHVESPLSAFLSLDKAQLRAAYELGLPT